MDVKCKVGASIFGIACCTVALIASIFIVTPFLDWVFGPVYAPAWLRWGIIPVVLIAVISLFRDASNTAYFLCRAWKQR